MYIQNNFSYELARPIMGTIFLVIYNIYIRDSRLNRQESVSLASLARFARFARSPIIVRAILFL